MLFIAFLAMASVFVCTVLTVYLVIKKNPAWKKAGLAAIASVVLVFVLALTTDIEPPASQNNQQAQSPSAQQQPAQQQATPQQPSPAATVPLPSIQDKITAAVIEGCGETSNRKDVRRIVSIDYDGDGFAIIKLNADDGVTDSGTIYRIHDQSKNIIPGIFWTIPEVNEVTVQWMLPFVDVKGFTKDGLAANINCKRKTAATINWTAVNPDNIPKIVDLYGCHPAFRNK